jgi:hypothetical protein
MADNNRAAEHHVAAAMQHMQASRHHRESARHYETGKDFAHAAHQSLLAYGHAIRAVKAGDEARTHYAQHHLGVLPKPSAADPASRPVVAILDAAGTPPAHLNGVDHHIAAATHHEQAARHHKEAARQCSEKAYARAAHEAEMAHRHAHYSIFHFNEAAMHHVEHYGKSGQSAEIV